MPREVYETAVRGLGTLVSPRAASRLVDSALRAASRTPDDISSKAMRRLLLGRIRHELHGVLPGPALEAGLQRVAAEIERQAAAAARAKEEAALPGVGFQTRVASTKDKGRVKDQDADRAEDGSPPRRGFNPFRRRRSNARTEPAAEGVVAEAPTGHKATDTPLAEALLDPSTLSSREAVRRSSVYLPGLDVPEELRPVERAVDVTDSGSSADVVDDLILHELQGSPAQVAPPQTGAKTKRHLGLDDKAVEAAVKAFAEVETVRQIVISRGTKVLQTRGGGVDADRLAPLAVSTRALLERAGQLHVYSVEQPGGVLFLFPLHDGTVSVLTQPNVNIGAVLAARAALEEAA